MTPEVFVRPDEAAGQGPPTLERSLPASDQQHLQALLADGEDHQVDRHGEGRESARVVVGHGLSLTAYRLSDEKQSSVST